MTVFLGFFPKLFAKSAAGAVLAPEIVTPASPALPFELHADVRAVARSVERP